MTWLIIVLPIFGIVAIPLWCACVVSGRCDGYQLPRPTHVSQWRHPYYARPSDN